MGRWEGSDNSVLFVSISMSWLHSLDPRHKEAISGPFMGSSRWLARVGQRQREKEEGRVLTRSKGWAPWANESRVKVNVSVALLFVCFCFSSHFDALLEFFIATVYKYIYSHVYV